MKTIQKSIIVLLVLIGLVACGGSSVETQKEEKNENKSEDKNETYISIKIDRDCIKTPNIEILETYFPLLSGDTIVKDEEKTEIEVYHGDNEMKVACIVNGKAHIVRLLKGVLDEK